MRHALIVLMLSASPCFATTFKKPERHDVFSHNGAFVLDVDPKTNVHTVYDVRDRSKPLWSFNDKIWISPILLSDDGMIVATVEWKFVRAQDIPETTAVTFWNKEGAFRKYRLLDLCPDPPKSKDLDASLGGSPTGDFWRTWYTAVTDDGEFFTIRTTCGVEYRFRFADGDLVEKHRFADRDPVESQQSRLPSWLGAWLAAAGGIAFLIVAGVFCWRRWERLPTH